MRFIFPICIVLLTFPILLFGNTHPAQNIKSFAKLSLFDGGAPKTVAERFFSRISADPFNSFLAVFQILAISAGRVCLSLEVGAVTPGLNRLGS